MKGASPPPAPPTAGASQVHLAGSASGGGPLAIPRMPSLSPSGPHQNYGGVLQMQYRPQGPPQPGQQFMSMGSQQYGPPPGMSPQLGIPPNLQGMGPQNMPPSSQPPQYSASPIQQMPLRPPHQPQPQSGQPLAMPYSQHPRPMSTGPLQQQHPQHNMPQGPPGPSNPGMPPASFGFTSPLPYPQAPNSFGMSPAPFQNLGHPLPMQQQPMQSVKQPWSMVPGKSMAPVVPQGLQAAAPHPQLVAPPTTVPAVIAAPMSVPVPMGLPGPSDWQEHTAPDGRRYYHNKRTKLSSWEKPGELMTPTERADASTVWKEFTAADGRKYYYNKVTKQSKWTMPEEMKAAREQVDHPLPTTTSAPAYEAPSIPGPLAAAPIIVAATTPSLQPLASPKPIVVSTLPPAPVFLAAPAPAPAPVAVPAPVVQPVMLMPASSPSVANVASTPGMPAALDVTKDANTPNNSKEDAAAAAQILEEAKKEMPQPGKVTITRIPSPSPVVDEPVTYANKVEAKNAFKELLEFVRVESDWTWDQAMRVIANDKRYGALKTLGEKKQCFNEYLAQRKKLESEEKRLKQKKAREDFLAMLEESKELTSAMRWSKALTLFEDDLRFLAVEKDREREELFEDYLVDLERKEREKAREERKKNLAEYRSFLESCDFIKANPQWRKVQDKLEDDERCSRLDKIDRLEVFQEYIRDLEKEEEEEKKLVKEQVRRKERKHRDEFRIMMDEHKVLGILNARTVWRDYLVKVKDHVAYQSVATNTSGSTPKELFEDFADELDKLYYVEKGKVKDAMKDGKIIVTSSWSFDKFKAALTEAGDIGSVSEQNLKILFDDLLKRAKEKDEKEARKRRRLADDFLDLLRTVKAISAASKWEDARSLFEDTAEFRAIHDESLRKKTFEEHTAHLQQRLKEKERKREKEEKALKEKEKEKDKESERRKEKDKDKERLKREKEVANDAMETVNNHSSLREEKKKDKERDREREKDRGDRDRDRDKEKEKKHRKRHKSSSEELLSEKEDKEEPRRAHRHGTEHRKVTRKHGHDSGSDNDTKYKRHRRDRDASRRTGAADELEDGELGEDGEIR